MSVGGGPTKGIVLVRNLALVRRNVAVDLLASISTSALGTWVIRSHSGSRRPPRIELFV